MILQTIKYMVPVSLCLLLITSCGNKNQSSTYGDVAIADEEQTSDWLAYGRTHNERRFSPATDISTENVSGLKVDWYIDLPDDVGPGLHAIGR